VHRVAKEMNGYDLRTGKLLSSPGGLKDDGTTSCGNWLWCGMYTEEGNMAARRGTTDPSGIGLFPNWGWAWPVNRRIMYNRASVDLDGRPWGADHPVISWDGTSWVGDVPDGGWEPVHTSGKYPFIMKPEGRGYLFGPGRPDGPFPEHYEPWESPLLNPMSPQQNNPAIKSWETIARGAAVDYPIVATTHRVVPVLRWQALEEKTAASTVVLFSRIPPMMWQRGGRLLVLGVGEHPLINASDIIVTVMLIHSLFIGLCVVVILPVHPGTIRYLKEIGKWTAADDARHEYNLRLNQAYIDAWDKARDQASIRKIKVAADSAEFADLWRSVKRGMGVPGYRTMTDEQIKEGLTLLDRLGF